MNDNGMMPGMRILLFHYNSVDNSNFVPLFHSRPVR